MAHVGYHQLGNLEFDVWSVDEYGKVPGRGLYAFGVVHDCGIYILYFGQATDFSERHTTSHDQIEVARLLGMNVLLTHRLDWASEAKLQAIEADFIRALRPPLNIQHNSPRRLGERTSDSSEWWGAPGQATPLGMRLGERC